MERLFKQLKSMVPVGDKLLKAPRNAKELMATRLLEGHFVRCSCRGIQVCNSAVSLFFLSCCEGCLRHSYIALFLE